MTANETNTQDSDSPVDKNDPNYVRIFDTTLRDGEQSPGCSMNLEEKVRVAHVLEELGVDYNIHLINIGKDEQFAPNFLKIIANSFIRAMFKSL